MALFLTNVSRSRVGDATAPFAQKSLRNFAKAALLSTALVVAPALSLSVVSSADAQSLADSARDPNAQLLLKADELIYDNDNEEVTASGNVQLDYDGYNVVAEKVRYNQKTRRVMAIGNVEILEPNGNKIYADEIDLTDDFGQGFVNALRVETPDNTRFAAESAERFAGQKTVFHHGVYTACEPCKERPEKAPIWQVKAQKVILNGVTKTVTYKNATFELFGLPIAYLPYFSHADPSVKRKTGFLIPSVGYRQDLGAFYRQSFFWATSDTTDLTFSGTYYQKQGFLGEVEWRQAFNNGFYKIKAAGISQQSPSEFNTAPDTVEIERGMIATEGEYRFNPRWKLGWDVMLQTDDTFSNTYDIEGNSSTTFTNEIFLRGLAGRSYFDLSGYDYQIQGTNFLREREQAFVRPVLDYNLVTEAPEGVGGDVSLDVNVTSIERDDLSVLLATDYSKAGPTAVNDPVSNKRIVSTVGVKGETTRASASLAWQKTLITDNGVTLTPFASIRGDFISTDATSSGLTENSAGTVAVLEQGETTRFMPTIGVEASYPILARTDNSSHVFEPIVQLLLRPDLNDSGITPNEDAQSLVFDATNLFSRDKFSGFDRMESGSRVNLGVRYSGIFDNGLSLNGVFGQSYHIGGDNPFETDGLTRVGVDSGLDKDVSDYVGSLGLATLSGLSLSGRARFDNSSFEVKRGEVEAGYSHRRFNIAARYTYIAEQPNFGTSADRQEIALSGGVKLGEYWRAFGSASYDIENDELYSKKVGISYNDECFSLSLAFSETSSRYDTTEANRSIGFKVGIRTIGDFEESIDVDDLADFGQGGFLDNF